MDIRADKSVAKKAKLVFTTDSDGIKRAKTDKNGAVVLQPQQGQADCLKTQESQTDASAAKTPKSVITTDPDRAKRGENLAGVVPQMPSPFLSILQSCLMPRNKLVLETVSAGTISAEIEDASAAKKAQSVITTDFDRAKRAKIASTAVTNVETGRKECKLLSVSYITANLYCICLSTCFMFT